MAQNGPTIARCAICDSVKLRTSSHKLPLRRAASTRPTAAVDSARGHVQLPLARPIRVPADEHHRDERRDEGDRRDRAQREAARAATRPAASSAATGRCRIDEGVHEKHAAQDPHASAREACAERRVPDGLPPRLLVGHRPRRATRARSGGSQSACSGRSVRTRSASTPRTTAGQPFDQEQPLPSGEPHASVERKQRLGHRPADDHRDGAAIMNSAPVLARSRAGIQ